jgi:hypothetical protein
MTIPSRVTFEQFRAMTSMCPAKLGTPLRLTYQSCPSLNNTNDNNIRPVLFTQETCRFYPPIVNPPRSTRAATADDPEQALL